MKTKLYFFLWVCLSTLLIACVDDDIEPDVVPVTGVSLNKTALALDEGESESLIATVIPDNATNKKVTWKSSDTSVATVNASGKVTAQATGTVVEFGGAKGSKVGYDGPHSSPGLYHDRQHMVMGLWNLRYL